MVALDARTKRVLRVVLLVVVPLWLVATLVLSAALDYMSWRDCGGVRGTPTSEGCHPFDPFDVLWAAGLAAVPLAAVAAAVLAATSLDARKQQDRQRTGTG